MYHHTYTYNTMQYYYYYYYCYIDEHIYLNLSKSNQSATGLKALKPAANGHYLMCKSLPCYLHLLYKSTFMLLLHFTFSKWTHFRLEVRILQQNMLTRNFVVIARTSLHLSNHTPFFSHTFTLLSSCCYSFENVLWLVDSSYEKPSWSHKKWNYMAGEMHKEFT